MLNDKSSTQAKILARALYEIRVLLSGYLGSQTVADMSARQAAHLSYALHNEALAVVDDRAFDPVAAVRGLKAVDAMLGSEFLEIFGALLESAPNETTLGHSPLAVSRLAIELEGPPAPTAIEPSGGRFGK